MINLFRQATNEHPPPPPSPAFPFIPDLGYSASESYGVAYKARGLCKTLENLDIFDDTQDFDYAVYGDILNSELHHNVSLAASYNMTQQGNTPDRTYSTALRLVCRRWLRSDINIGNLSKSTV